MQFNPQVIEAIFDHGKQCFPYESCGVVILENGVQTYVPCRNKAEGELGLDRFVIHEEDFAAAEERGELLAIAHSHPNASANPTDADILMCERSELPWIIIGVPSGVFRVIEPAGRQLPLVGRQFFHGVVDCYSLIRDYYRIRLGIALPDFGRTDDWWVRGEDLYRLNFESAGFKVVATDGNFTPNAHDVILMQIRSNQLNHGAVMDSDMPGHILHHLHGQLSRHDVWGGVWARHTGLILRHEALA